MGNRGLSSGSYSVGCRTSALISPYGLAGRGPPGGGGLALRGGAATFSGVEASAPRGSVVVAEVELLALGTEVGDGEEGEGLEGE